MRPDRPADSKARPATKQIELISNFATQIVIAPETPLSKVNGLHAAVYSPHLGGRMSIELPYSPASE
jgi:hypothetical protein